MRGKHKTRLIALKKERIDVDAIPLVRWLNHFAGVHTIACCQGDDEGDYAHVFFACGDISDLALILEMVHGFEFELAATDDRYEGPELAHGMWFPEGEPKIHGWEPVRVTAQGGPWAERELYPCRFDMEFGSRELMVRFSEYVTDG